MAKYTIINDHFVSEIFFLNKIIINLIIYELLSISDIHTSVFNPQNLSNWMLGILNEFPTDA